MSPTMICIAPDAVSEFDAVYVVSDLHMGGRTPDPQMFKSGADLANLITHLKDVPDGHVALVLNGDVVDFLAEPDAAAFDPRGAADKLQRIADDPAFAPVWTELRKFTATEGRHLAITLGNHDIELALPWVRERLMGLLASDAAARQRITLAFDGAGFRCRVGRANVLCVHGNEIDDWNVTDFEAMRRIVRDIQRGRAIERWVPNAGSQLVVEVMNGLKRQYPFVDLLKPEIGAVVPTLYTLNPKAVERMEDVIDPLIRLGHDKVRRAFDLLGDETSATGSPMAAAHRRPYRPIDADQMLDAAEEQFGERKTASSLLVEQGYLGTWSGLFKLITGHKRTEVLREALKDLRDYEDFNWWHMDETYTKLDEQIGDCIDFIVAGHTHFRRALRRRKAAGYYFNSGTWARLIQLTPDQLGDDKKFEAAYDALAKGSMAALDDAGLVSLLHTVVAIQKVPDGTEGKLLEWAGDRLQSVPSACFLKT